MNDIVIGKRVTVGAAILGVSEAIQLMQPEYAQIIGAFTVPFIFIIQLAIAKRFGITTT